MPIPSKTTIGLRKKLLKESQHHGDWMALIENCTEVEKSSLCMWSLKAGHYALTSKLMGVCEKASIDKVKKRASVLIMETSPASRLFWSYLADHPEELELFIYKPSFYDKMAKDLFRQDLDSGSLEYKEKIFTHALRALDEKTDENIAFSKHIQSYFFGMYSTHPRHCALVFPKLPLPVQNAIRDVPQKRLASLMKSTIFKADHFRTLCQFHLIHLEEAIEDWRRWLLSQLQSKSPEIPVSVVANCLEALAEHTILPKSFRRECIDLLGSHLGEGLNACVHLMSQDLRADLQSLYVPPEAPSSPKKKL